MRLEEYQFWFGMIQTKHLIKLRALLNAAGGVKELFHMKEESIKKFPGIDGKLFESIIYSRNADKIHDLYIKMKESEMRFVCEEEAEYPERLKVLQNRPYGLFVKGRLPEDTAASAAIVGARGCSNYGKVAAEEYGRFLAEKGVQVISGMASGIDCWGHYGSLKAKGRTFAVLGNGVDICYPKENNSLYKTIQENGGILSEFPIGMPPKQWHFPMRNRIIAALADIVLVIEAKKKSGSLITVDFALEQGKDVYALPGRVHDALSYGCNELIQKGAGILLSPQDVLLALHITEEKKEKKIKKNNILLENEENMVYSCLDLQPKRMEEILELAALPMQRIFEILLALELKGYIEQPIPHYYVITVSERSSFIRCNEY